MPLVSVVIPTYNGLDLLKKHIPAVLNELQPHDEVIIIDDASTDATVLYLRDTYDLKQLANEHSNYNHFVGEHKKITIHLVENTKNLRFAKSVNRAVEHVSHSYIWLLNNDVAPHTGSRKALLDCITNAKNCFGVGCYEIEDHAGTQVIGGKNKLWFERGLFVHSRASDMKTGPTAWLSGGSALITTKYWRELQGFDPIYQPAYWEDIDLSARAHAKGWSTLFCETAKVDHNHESTNATVFKERRIKIASTKNSLWFWWKHSTWLQKMEHYVWLPYHLTITNIRSNGVFLNGWFLFILEYITNVGNKNNQ